MMGRVFLPHPNPHTFVLFIYASRTLALFTIGPSQCFYATCLQLSKNLYPYDRICADRIPTLLSMSIGCCPRPQLCYFAHDFRGCIILTLPSSIYIPGLDHPNRNPVDVARVPPSSCGFLGVQRRTADPFTCLPAK